MHSLEEKNHLSNELERTKKKLEESCENKEDMQKELQKTRLEIENVRRQMLQQEIHFNIQQTEALTRNLSPRGQNHSEADSGTLTRRGQNKNKSPEMQWNYDYQQQEDNESILTDMISPSGKFSRFFDIFLRILAVY